VIGIRAVAFTGACSVLPACATAGAVVCTLATFCLCPQPAAKTAARASPAQADHWNLRSNPFLLFANTQPAPEGVILRIRALGAPAPRKCDWGKRTEGSASNTAPIRTNLGFPGPGSPHTGLGSRGGDPSPLGTGETAKPNRVPAVSRPIRSEVLSAPSCPQGSAASLKPSASP